MSGIAAKVPAPETIAENHLRVGAGAKFAGKKSPAEHRLDAERFKELIADPRPGYGGRSAVLHQSPQSRKQSGDVLKRVATFANFQKIRPE